MNLAATVCSNSLHSPAERVAAGFGNSILFTAQRIVVERLADPIQPENKGLGARLRKSIDHIDPSKRERTFRMLMEINIRPNAPNDRGERTDGRIWRGEHRFKGALHFAPRFNTRFTRPQKNGTIRRACGGLRRRTLGSWFQFITR